MHADAVISSVSRWMYIVVASPIAGVSPVCVAGVPAANLSTVSVMCPQKHFDQRLEQQVRAPHVPSSQKMMVLPSFQKSPVPVAARHTYKYK